jgi:large conductance mechanosensitive channel
MFNGFKKFIVRGNVVDLAVGVVIGAAFGAVVTALVKDIFTPLMGAIIHMPDLSRLEFTVHGSTFMIGDFISAIISFLVVALAVYFVVVIPMNALLVRMKRGENVDPTDKQCLECLSKVPVLATRCAFCTQPIA